MNGALEIMAKLYPMSPEDLRQSRIFNMAQEVISEFFLDAIQKTSGRMIAISDAGTANAAFDEFIDELEVELRRRAQ